MIASNHSILIIDDEDIVRESVAAYLEDSGYRIYEACDGEQGMEVFERVQPDVVLCDLKMPRCDGIAVLKRIAAGGSGVPVIVISGAGVMSDVVEALRNGASDYLVKPIIDMEVLEYAINRCLEQGQLRSENKRYRQQLEGANLELRQSLAELQQDQQAGRQVQFKMLPSTPKQFGNYQFCHRILPSLYLSGDFIDYFIVGADHVVFFLADVSGHGASSAFVTVLLKNLFARKRSDYLHCDDPLILSPVGMLERANRELLDTEIGKYVTMCVGVLDLQSNSLDYSVAGHLPLPILATEGRAEFLSGKGMPVGLFEETDYSEKTLLLPDNFVLTLFSDGILEVLPVEDLQGKEQLLLGKLKAGCATPDEVAKALDITDLVDIPDDVAGLVISKVG